MIKTYKHLLTHRFEYEGIPKVIYRTGRYKVDELPIEVRELYEREMIENPAYTLFYFDDADCRQLIKDTQNESWYTTYDELIPSAYKADFWRYVVLFKFGGIYLDFSHMALVPFDEIIQGHTEFFLKDKSDLVGVNNSFIGCKKENKILFEAIQLCVQNVAQKNKVLKIFEITGPQLLEKAFRIAYRIEPNYILTLGLYSLIYKIIDHNLSNPDKDEGIYDMNGKQVIKYRGLSNHYNWMYDGQFNQLHYSSLYNKGLIYADQRWKDITELYRKHLLREPDFGGILTYHQFWGSVQDIEKSIMSSDEYKSKHGI